MEENLTMHEIQEKMKEIDRKKALVAEKMEFLKKEKQKLNAEKMELLSEAKKRGLLKISVRDFEKALEKIEHKQQKVSIKMDEDERKYDLFYEPLFVRDRESLKKAQSWIKRGVGSYYEIRLNKCPYFRVKTVDFPPNCENTNEIKVEDMILSFELDTLAGLSWVLDTFVQAEKDRAQATNPNLSAGGKR